MLSLLKLQPESMTPWCPAEAKKYSHSKLYLPKKWFVVTHLALNGCIKAFLKLGLYFRSWVRNSRFAQQNVPNE